MTYYLVKTWWRDGTTTEEYTRYLDEMEKLCLICTDVVERFKIVRTDHTEDSLLRETFRRAMEAEA